MGGRFSVAIFGMALLCASQASAGSSGNGSGEGSSPGTVARPHYSYCFGGRPKTVYFSSVIVSAPTIGRPGLNGPYGKYLTQKFGAASNDGGQCITSDTMADAANGKKQREASFVTTTWKIIETQWSGDAGR